MANFGQFLATFWQLFGPFWRGVANLLSILAAAKQGVYSKEYTVRDIPRALLVGLLIEVLGLHLMDPGMDRRAAVFQRAAGTPARKTGGRGGGDPGRLLFFASTRVFSTK